LNAGRLGKGVFDFSGDFVGALQGSGVWELEIDVEVALVLVR